MTKPPKVELGHFPGTHEHFYQSGDKRWSVARLIEEAKFYEEFDLPLAAIFTNQTIWKDATIKELAWHLKRCMDADLSKPIILDCHGEVADGRHRIVKALALGKTTIKAVRLQYAMEPCSVGCPDANENNSGQ